MRTHTVAELELSAAAYDEIERKLLEAGYDHVFARGPGSAIDLQGIAVTRMPVETFPVGMPAVYGEHAGQFMIEPELGKRQYFDTREQAKEALKPRRHIIIATDGPYVAPDHDAA